MSDVQTGGRGPCPACHGDGHQRIGPLTLLCDECGGEGATGGEEPAVRDDGYRMPVDGEEYDPGVHGPLPAAGGYPAWRSPS